MLPTTRWLRSPRPNGGARAAYLRSRARRRRAPAWRDRRARPRAASWVPAPARRRLDARPAALPTQAALDRWPLRAEGSRTWAGQPPSDEWLDAIALEPPGQDLVALAPGRPLARVVDARGGAHQHQSLHGLGMAQGHVEGESATHRVADPGRRPRTAAAATEVPIRSAPPRRSATHTRRGPVARGVHSAPRCDGSASGRGHRAPEPPTG